MFKFSNSFSIFRKVSICLLFSKIFQCFILSGTVGMYFTSILYLFLGKIGTLNTAAEVTKASILLELLKDCILKISQGGLVLGFYNPSVWDDFLGIFL